MRITTSPGASSASVVPVSDTAPADNVAAPGASASVAAPLQSDVLQPALAALRAMPDSDIDHDRVAQLRDALAKGELPFDPAKLAGLMQRFHGGGA